MDKIEKSLQDISQDVKLISEKVHTIDKETVKNTVILKEHKRRSLANEKRIEIVEERQFKEKIYHGGLMAAIFALAEIARRFL